MPVEKSSRIHAKDVDVTIHAVNGEDYISLTDLARHSSDRTGEVIRRWLRLSDTISFLSTWEKIESKVRQRCGRSDLGPIRP